MVAAGVPVRLEYMKVKALSYFTLRTTSRVSSKSSGVSPGKPTMMSVVMAMSGISLRMRSASSRYCSLV